MTINTVSLSEQPVRERLLLDFNWRFHLGDAADIARDFNFGKGKPYAKTAEVEGAVRVDFDDSYWRKIDLPHDWAVELEFDPRGIDNEHIYHGCKPVGRFYPSTSIGWYRKTFDIPKSYEGKRLSVEFDGVFRDSIVWLNGYCLGRHQSGYTSFRYDISDCVNYGGKNVLVVRVDTSHFEGWFYEGAGIYRHTWLVKAEPLHVAHWGTYVTSEVFENFADVFSRTRITNEGDSSEVFSLESVILDDTGRKVVSNVSEGIQIKPWEEIEVSSKIRVNDPQLWSIEQPNLYKLVSVIKNEAGIVDRYETVFGIRTIRFDTDNGFFLNDKPVKIKGVCCHQDHAGVGAALPDRIQYYRIEKLKEMGVNAYRTSHNPPTPELLDACDRLGMIVMDEHRQVGSSPEILGQLESLVLRDRNHPSIILWSIGNEEGGVQNHEHGARTAATMKRLVNRLDPTRLTTYGGNNGGEYKGINGVVDIRGWNYMNIGKNMDEYHRDHPHQPVIGSEEASTLCTRGIYENDEARCYVSSYDVNFPGWGSGAEEWWTYYAERPYLAGAFVWTGFDYRGEPTPYSWPCISSHFGIMDICGFPKDNYYYYKSWWTEKTVLHILPHWNWPGMEGHKTDVRCFSNCDSVELFLNGRSLGKKDMPANSHLQWTVEYEPGILTAKGYRGNALVAENSVETTDAPAAVKLVPDRTVIKADGEDVCMAEVSVVDDKGRIVPIADNEIEFEVNGNAVIIGVGNGDPSSHEPDKASKRKAFNGLCMVIVQASKEAGPIEIKAKSAGLEGASLAIRSETCIPKPCI